MHLCHRGSSKKINNACNYILKAKSNFTLFMYLPFGCTGECYLKPV